MKSLILFAVFATAAAGQAPAGFTATKSQSLTAAAQTLTVQFATAVPQPNPGYKIHFIGASIYCSAACTVQLERDGSAPSATALTITAVNQVASTTNAAAFFDSNVGAGTVLTQYSLTAGSTLTLDLTSKWLRIAGENLTLRTNSITGTAQTNIQWEEVR